MEFIKKNEIRNLLETGWRSAGIALKTSYVERGPICASNLHPQKILSETKIVEKIHPKKKNIFENAISEKKSELRKKKMSS